MADTPKNIAVQDAEALLNGIEQNGLQTILDALTTFDGVLKTMLDGFPLSARSSSDARRIATELRNNQLYRIQTELPNLIAKVSGVAPTAPTP